MSDSTVPSEHYIATVKALVKLVNRVDELEGQIRDYEDAFEQFTKDAHNAENAEWWLSDAGIEAVQNAFGANADEPIPYTITEPAPDFSSATNPENFTYSLAEAAAILQRQGIDTGQNRLKAFLNEGICWTDGMGALRKNVAEDYLVETESANPSRDAVVRVTPEGVNELVRVMNVAI